MDVFDLASEISLFQGEYQIWTDKKIQTDQDIGGVENPFLGIKIYPNPVMEDITIASNNGPVSSYEIIDSQGRILSNISFKIPKPEFNVNVSDLPQGVYFLKVITGKKTGIAKFIR